MSAASISVSHLSWFTPDGDIVLDDLTLDFGPERTGLIGRNGVGKSTLLRLLAGDIPPATGTVRIQGTTSTLRQVVQIGAHETVADLFGVSAELVLLRKAEAGQGTMGELANADWTLEARAGEALAQLGLDVPLDTPLLRLSGGQRTRAALAGAVFAQPDFLLLDEPTNNLDHNGRRAVYDLLQGWRSGAIVVSHDRELLEMMDAIVELHSLGASRYGGNWSHYLERQAVDLAAARHDLASAERRRAEIARRAQLANERQQRRNSAGGRKAARGGMPRILMGARREQAQNSGAANQRLASRQHANADRAIAEAKERIEVLEPLTVTLAPTGLAPSRAVLALDSVTAGYEPSHSVLRDVSLTISGPERVAITGANGTGKSTLLRVIVGDLVPSSGAVALHTDFALFDQRLAILKSAATIADNFARLNPGVDENGCRAALARFQFRAEAANQLVGTLSGGQMLRAGLACVIGGPKPPPLLMLDEPTNHLDLASIAAVEAGLAAFDGALLVVSHDAAFLENIGVTRRLSL